MDEQVLKELQALKETLKSIQRRIAELEQKATISTMTAPQASASSMEAKVSAGPASLATTPVPIKDRQETTQSIPVTPLRPTAPVSTPAHPLVVKATPSTPSPIEAPTTISAQQEPCSQHPGKTIQWRCAKCQTPLCPDCGGVAWQGHVYCRKCEKPVSPALEKPTEESGRKRWEAFEIRVGRYWLNRIGITSLVLGVVFFILYTFQYLGPAMKIAIGMMVAGGLLGSGVWLERRMALQWYARGLIGGGWALLYFTTYAMHHIAAVKILDTAWIDLCLLMFVASGAVWHSLKYRSETISVLALLLGFITTSISQVTYFTLLSSGLLVTALVWLVVRMRWDRLYLYGVVASYATHLLWIKPQIARSLIVAHHFGNVAQEAFWLNAGFLALYWVAYTFVLFALDEQELGRRNRLLTATLTNAALFVYTVLAAMTRVYPEWRYLFVLAVGAFYICSELLMSRKNLPAVRATHALVGLSLITLAVPLKISGYWFSFWWLIEDALVLLVGLRYARWPYRLFAFALMLLMMGRLLLLDLWNAVPVAVMSWQIPWRVLIGGVGIATFGLAATWYRLPRFRETLRQIESHAFHAYFIAAVLLLWMLTAVEVNNPWVAAVWAVEAAGTMLLGFWLKDSILRGIGTVGFGVTGLRLLSEWGSWSLWATVWVIAIVYAVSWLYRLMSASKRVESAPWVQDSYAIAALLILTLLLHDQVNSQWISLAWLFEMAALVTLGLLLREKPFRLFAFWFALVVLLRLLYQNFFSFQLQQPHHVVGLFGLLIPLDIVRPQTPYPPLVLFGVAIPWRIFVGSIAIAAFGATACWYRLPRFQATLRPIEAEGFHLYFFCAAAVMWMLITDEVHIDWVASAWAAEAAGTTWLGFRLKDKTLRLMGVAGFGMVALRLLWRFGWWNLWATVPAVALCYGMGLSYRWLLSPPQQEGIERYLQNAYAIAASVLLTALIGTEANRHWLSVAWAIEGLALVAAGFVLRDKVFRISGLSVFGLLVLKILFVDLAGAETIYRILSFIVAGVILLLASFAYARFTGKPAPPQKP